MVDCQISLGNEAVPFGEWKRGIHCREASNKVVFPRLDGAFCCVETVAVGRNALEVNVVLGEGCFDDGGTIVIDEVELWYIAVGLEELVGVEPSVADGAAKSVRQCFSVDVVRIVVVHKKNVAAASTRRSRKSSCLVRVGGREFFLVNESGEGIVGGGISGLRRRCNVERSGDWDVGEKSFGRV